LLAATPPLPSFYTLWGLFRVYTAAASVVAFAQNDLQAPSIPVTCYRSTLTPSRRGTASFLFQPAVAMCLGQLAQKGQHEQELKVIVLTGSRTKVREEKPMD
jgi:hypothetical protein